MSKNRTRFIITGTSRGIGKALASSALREGNLVTGISRSCSITDKNYTHLNCDLSSPEFLDRLDFPEVEEGEHLVLVNNSGMIGNLKRMGQERDDLIISAYFLNLIAPHLLINRFLKVYQSFPGEKVVLNISSGAAVNAIDAWSEYCSSKAALNMLTMVGNVEREFANYPTTFYSISPGVIDTQMQAEIRKSDPESFSRHAYFKELQKNNELVSADLIAQKIMFILANRQKFTEQFISLRDINL